MVTCTETHLWISQPNCYLFYKYKKLLSQKQNLCVDKSSQTNIFTTCCLCSNILYCEHGVSFLLSPSRIYVLVHPWTPMLLNTLCIVDSRWRHNCCHWLWMEERHTDQATTWYETYVMTYVATWPSLHDFPLWIRLDLDPDRVSSETRSGSKPSLESSLKSRLLVNTAPGVKSTMKM